MTPRFKALELAGERGQVVRRVEHTPDVEHFFQSHVFHRGIMEKMLDEPVYENVLRAMEGIEKLKPEYADKVAYAMKEWAIGLGATHFSHLFQPLTGSTAEKHDSFIDWHQGNGVIEKFNGKQLLQGEPDASSFPSGGLRSTYEARGYTGWDPSSPAFIWQAGDGVTLCIPSVFFSWTGEALDAKIPLLRSDEAIQTACLRLLKHLKIPATRVFSTLGFEQEYFVIDRALRNLRPDLVILGKTVFGAPAAKGQELQDHYFGSVKDRVLAYMRDFEKQALQLGIPVKTRHNEVAPAQHEVAPIFEKSSLAVDHNILLMELMRKVAVKHGMACLLHEKPFANLNGSGKHNNWSLATDTGLNLLDPSDAPETQLQFLILLTAILSAVHRHADLLLASIASAGNDCRLGGHEAPPAIISVYLGEALEAFLNDIEVKGSYNSPKGGARYDLGLLALPEMSRDNTDRNRTSPFAFTGNKFEFRAVGSSANCAHATSLINMAVAEALNEILDKVEAKGGDFEQAAMSVIREQLKTSKPIRFSGDNYSKEWEKEAKARGLPKVHNAAAAYKAFREEKAAKLFKGVLSATELNSRTEILEEIYCHHIKIEANLAIEIFRTQILPASIRYQQVLASSIAALEEVLGTKSKSRQLRDLEHLSKVIDRAIEAIDKLEEAKCDAEGLQGVLSAEAFAGRVAPSIKEARVFVDQLEQLVDDALWPIPKYRELLFLI